jgi:hypothetical protein
MAEVEPLKIRIGRCLEKDSQIATNKRIADSPDIMDPILATVFQYPKKSG